ncbi:putative vitellogenin receptor [Drosophila ananassae]|uniref:putative vitellogenin receptor n=1 Tax=Drosophila ananassae TaxID=7217 RepID=UPI0013A5EF0C|nr:putative vitellogenin receptor [Drosophila ananassae]
MFPRVEEHFHSLESQEEIAGPGPKMRAGGGQRFNLTSIANQTRARHLAKSPRIAQNGYGHGCGVGHGCVAAMLLLCGAILATAAGSQDAGTCEAGQFRCRDGGCILLAKMCDGHGDCKDGTDELDCDYRLCREPHWFPCAPPHGACLAAELMCNGIDNCPGGEDELNCPGRTLFPQRRRNCSSSEWTCQQDRTCLPLELMCDGRADCSDRSDELAGCERQKTEANCPPEGHLCPNGRCLRRRQWLCDGHDDCGDGSDEKGCENLCQPQMGKFMCRNKEACLPLSDACDGHRDCSDDSDEAEGCHSPPDCKTKKCPPNATCHMMPSGGAECHCPVGFRQAKFEDKCVDIDECQESEQEQRDVCSQKCENQSGGFQCVCDEGYHLARDNRTCRAMATSSSTDQAPLLLYTTQMTVMGMHLQEDNDRNHVFLVAGNLTKVIGVAYDGSHIYWTNIQNEAESLVRAKGDGSQAETLLTSGLDAPEDLAVDWLTQNIYFSDNAMRHIAVCSHDGLNCAVLVTQDVHQPRSLALWPQRGLMFWTDWGVRPMIARASMDGTRSRPIVSDNIHWPNGIALDMHQQQGRIYWVDAKLGSVQTVRIDGSGRRTILDGVLKHPYGLALFEDQLFWSDWVTKSVHSCHKFTGKGHRVLAKDRTIYAVHVYHPAKQPQSSHGCQTASCSHFCLLAEPEAGGHSCACPDGMRLAADQQRCIRTEKRQRLFIGMQRVLLEIEHTAFGRHSVSASHVLDGFIDEMVFNPVNGSLIIADNRQRIIFEYHPAVKYMERLVSNLGNVSALAFDHLSRNIYWADAEKGVVELLSLQTRERALIRLFPGQEWPVGLAVVPGEGHLYVLLKSRRRSHIDRIPLSGKGEQVHVVEDDLGDDDFKLAVDPETHTLFWSDSDLGRISYTDYRTVQPQIFRGKLRRPYALALVQQDLFWSEMNSNGIYWAHKNNLGPRKRINVEPKDGPVSAPRMIPLAASSLPPRDSHPCQQQNGGCSHICVGEGAYHTVCLCPAGFVFRDAGNRTCMEALDCEFRCGSGECLTMAHRCNGHRDCLDSSDETDCDEEHRRRTKVMCSGRQFACHSGDQCVDKERRCDGRKDCQDQSDEQHCEKFDKTKKCHAHQHACDNGKCVDASLRCDGMNDCGDDSDEMHCGDSAVGCEEGMFRCSSGSCLPAGWECDGKIDCSDGSDEHDKCGRRSCPPEMHRCLLGQCLDKKLICNGHNDCGDGSDELNCSDEAKSNLSCPAEKFQCTSNPRICLPGRTRCNGTAECPRGEDEADCGDMCGIEEFQCRSGGQCIRREFRCDGDRDCTDGSDELACELVIKNRNQTEGIRPEASPSGRPCRASLFDCRDGQECVDMSRVCNGFPDCSNGMDEGPQCTTACSKSSCQHKCRATPSGAICSCHDGYRLDGDQRSCVDVDECQEQQPCAQLCENTLGSYQCQCHADFMLRQDRVSCKSLHAASALLFTSYNEVRNMTEQPVMLEVAWSANDSRISGFDVDVKRQVGYFSSEEDGLLYQIDLKNKQRIRGLAVDAPTKLSLDWATGNVYILSGGSGALEVQVCSFEAGMCGRIVKVKSPRHLKHLAVDGYHSRLFYVALRSESLGHSQSELHMSRLDGSRHELLLQRSDSYVSALTTDPHQQLLYFVDLHTRTLERMPYRPRNGPQRRPEVMLQKSNALLQPSGLSVFENHVYLVNLGAKEAVRCRMYGSRVCNFINLNVLNAQDVVVAAASRQPQPAAHPCVHAHCRGMCIQADYGYECMCGHQKVAEGEHCPHGSGNEVFLESKYSASESSPSSSDNQGTSFHWWLALLILAIGSLVAGLGYMYFQYRRRGHRDLNINLHFQNPLATLARADPKATESSAVVEFAPEQGYGSEEPASQPPAGMAAPNVFQRFMRSRQSRDDPMATELLLDTPRASTVHSLEGGRQRIGVPDILVAEFEDTAPPDCPAGQYGGRFPGDDPHA